jgi:ribosomal protein L3 glutamine methyltransferase
MLLKTLVEITADALEDAQVALGQGSLSFWDEAAWLVLSTLQLPLDTDLDHWNSPIKLENQAHVQACVHKRITERLPMAYLAKEAWLQGIPFYVDERCIIPRSFIAEVLANGDLSPFFARSPLRIMDLCTGNGSLAILAAMAYEQAHIWALDICPQALEVAQINVIGHGLQNRVTLILGDAWAESTAAAFPDHFDLILCNPPYVSAASLAALPPEFRAEPQLALDGNIDQGQDGMDWLRRWLAPTLAHLSPGGWLVLEVGRERPHFEAAFPHLEGIWLAKGALKEEGNEPVVILSARH